jgi:hypothetical protein
MLKVTASKLVAAVADAKAHGAEVVPNLTGGRRLLINPGTVTGIDAPPTYALGDLQSLTFPIRDVPHTDQ